MKKIFLIILAISLLVIAGCSQQKKNLYLPETKNDKAFTTVGKEEKNSQSEPILHNGNVYIVSWEYPKNTSEDLKKELSDIAQTFNLAE